MSKKEISLNQDQELSDTWVKIKDYENLYEINNKGVIRHVKYHRFKKPSLTPSGYHKITLCKYSNPKTYLIHRLVAEHFVTNKYNKPHVNHMDGNKLNNNYLNLEWCTPSENHNHAIKMGLKIVESNINDELITFQHKEHGTVTKTRQQMIREFNLNPSKLSAIILGRRKSHKGWKIT